MRLCLLALVLAASSGLSAVAGTTDLDGTWKYSGSDAAFQVRLKRGGECFVNAAASNWGTLAHCTYELDWPNVDIHWKDVDGPVPPPLHLVLVGHGELMRVEGEAKRPLRRAWDEPPDLPPQVNLNKPGALAALELRDPEGYRRVNELIDLVHAAGCRGAVVSEIKALVQLEVIGCGLMDKPPKSTILGFWLGTERYWLEIPPG
jgi:hypothetical protein